MQENPQNPPNNKEEINIGFTLEDEANQDIKGNKENQSTIKKINNNNQTSIQNFSSNISSIDKQSDVNSKSQNLELNEQIDIFNDYQNKEEQCQKNQENMKEKKQKKENINTNKSDNQNVNGSIGPKIKDQFGSIDLEQNYLEIKDEQKEKHQRENNKNIEDNKQLQSQDKKNKEVKAQKEYEEKIESNNLIFLNIANIVNDSILETKKLNSTLSGFITEIKNEFDNQKEYNESIKKSLENQEKSIGELKTFNNLVFEWMKAQSGPNNWKK